MKRLILTNRQLNEILSEENTTTVQINTNGNNLSSITNALNKNNSKIQKAGTFGDVKLHVSNQNSSGNQDDVPSQHVNVETGDSVEDSIKNQVNPSLLAQGSAVDVGGPGLSEYKTFTKKMVEEARLEKIRREGTVLSKLLLHNSFFD